MIWDLENDEYRLAPFTTESLQAAEKSLGIALPKTYIQLMQSQNGGVPLHTAFPCKTPNSWATDHVPVHSIYGIGEDGILQSDYLIREWGLPKKVVLFSGDGHLWLAMDYRETKSEPPIIFIDGEQEQIIGLAPDFASFLNGLYTAEEEDTDYTTEQQGEDLKFERIDAAFLQEEADGWIWAFNALYEKTAGNERYIENKVLELLTQPSEHLKQLAADYVMVYNERFTFSESTMLAIYEKMEQDALLQFEVAPLKAYLKQVKGLID
ncbi:SMI1/KNR4 family protein [Planococcus sp. N028]|uniref:SMI1/KNR4 family protein n=1 Tax=Planococcus shixiaomingii TaxID=3058393 RepID=A0ABT8N570_9BACL|nr:SMI1/KNR4 family protein [Planococcus sp. N028]MDN7243040.1 SMI1/KNR4 family protein [Planococcus sp. N028]